MEHAAKVIVEQRQIFINLGPVAPGTYFVSWANEGRVVTKRLVVQ